MKIALIDVESDKKIAVNKDLSGGFGTASIYGNSIYTKILMYIKKYSVKLPVLSLSYLASIFKKNYEVVTEFKGIKDLDIAIIQSSIVDYKNEINCAKEIKNNNKNTSVGFIGPFASVKADIFLECSDFVIIGEPENACMKITDGLVPKGKIYSEPVDDLNKLPFPYWGPFNINKYSYSPSIRKKPFLPVLSSRGCSLPCGYYCPYPVFEGKKWRYREPDSVVDELEYLVKTYKVKGVLFRDPLFTINENRVLEISEKILRKGIKIDWACETHFNYLNEKLIDLMLKSGLKTINVGVESPNLDILEASGRKNVRLEHQERIANYCSLKGIQLGAFYIFGFTADTEESIKRTIEYSKKLNTEFAQFTILTPYPGTKFYDNIKEKIFTNNWEDFNIYTPVFKNDNISSQKLIKLKEKAYKEYYFRFFFLIKTLYKIIKRWVI